MQDFFTFCNKFDPKDFQTILSEGQLIRCKAGDVVYRQGDRSDSFYVLNEGAVEVDVLDEREGKSIPVAYLAKGEIFGEVGLLTGAPRSDSARVPEKAVLLKFSKAGFERLVFQVPSFAFYVACLLARRLNQTTLQLRFYSKTRELAGSLDAFDLPIIFQTIFLSQQNGVMDIRNSAGEVLGEFEFRVGKPVLARYHHLSGKEALFDFFQSAPKATFSFSSLPNPPNVENPIEIKDMSDFFMNAIWQRDELKAMQQRLNLEHPLGRLHGKFGWTGDPTFLNCAMLIWEHLIDVRLSPRELYNKLPYCQYAITRVLVHMLDEKQLTPAKITSYGYR